VLIDCDASETHGDSLVPTAFESQRDPSAKHLLVNFAMMHFAKRRFQLWIMVPACGVVFVDTQNAGRNCDSLAFALLLPRLAPCRADWLPISHA